MSDPGLPMTMGYFRLILRRFGDTPERRRALLEGTGLSEDDLDNPAADISVFQQVRQIENATRLLGSDWAIAHPKAWELPAHGALAVAVVSAPTIAAGLEVLRRFGHVRSPWFRVFLRRRSEAIHIAFELTVALTVAQWRPMMEIAFLAVKSMIETALERPPSGMGFHFACPKPPHCERLGSALQSSIRFNAAVNSVSVPASWRSVASAHADAPLYAHAVAELEDVLARLEQPTNLRAQVERLLRTMPAGRLDAPGVARALGVSRRTLARRLKDAGASFRVLLDAELKARAETMLGQKLTRPEMAERLGYHDPTSFSRACRRWFDA